MKGGLGCGVEGCVLNKGGEEWKTSWNVFLLGLFEQLCL